MYLETLELLTKMNDCELKASLALQKNKAMSYSEIILYGTIESKKYLSLINYQSIRDMKNKRSFQKVILANQIEISPELFKRLKQNVQKFS